MSVIAALLLVKDAHREGLLRRAEQEFDATLEPESERMWGEYVDEDAQRLGEWRALLPYLVLG